MSGRECQLGRLGQGRWFVREVVVERTAGSAATSADGDLVPVDGAVAGERLRGEVGGTVGDGTSRERPGTGSEQRVELAADTAGETAYERC